MCDEIYDKWSILYTGFRIMVERCLMLRVYSKKSRYQNTTAYTGDNQAGRGITRDIANG